MITQRQMWNIQILKIVASYCVDKAPDYVEAFFKEYIQIEAFSKLSGLCLNPVCIRLIEQLVHVWGVDLEPVLPA